MRRCVALLVLGGLLAPAAVAADILLPPGFTAERYVTGEGFGAAVAQENRGVPAVSTLAFDRAGVLYLARSGRRYTGGEVDDLGRIYRIPPGGAHLTPATENRYLYGPPLPNPQVSIARDGEDVFVTTFDRDRRVGVLYRVVDGRAELFAGGTPPPGLTPLLVQPEGVAGDATGNIYVADRAKDVVVRLDAAGRVLDASHVGVKRPRVLALGGAGDLWVGSDGNAEAPWQTGPGEIWRVARDAAPALVLRGPMPAAIAVNVTGDLLVADRQGAQVLIVTPDRVTQRFIKFTEGDAPRALAFAPVTPETQRAGIAGNLFVVTIRRATWPVNEILRIAGPFDQLRPR